MKKFLVMLLLMMSSFVFSQQTITVNANSEDIAYSLDLKVVAQLFAAASTTEQFENMLNNPDSAFSNLDLNGDSQIDYLRVVEAGTADSKLIVIQAILAKDIYQDVASIYVEKDTKTQEVSVQIIGDEYIYGTNYIIEPVYVYRPVIYNWFWSPRWYCWESPWYWGYWPSWWYYRPCYTYHWYWDRCYRFHHHYHYCSFHHGHRPHHNYHAVHSSVSRRDYAVSHPDNSFNRRHTNSNNVRDLRTGVANRTSSRTNTAVRSNPNPTVSRSSSAQRSTSVQTRSQQSSTSTYRPSGSVTRTQQSTSSQRSSSSSTRSSQSSYQRSGSSTRSSSSYNRSSGSPATRSSGSVQRSSGSSQRSSRSSRSGGSSRR